jgi:hypothetical protein
MLATTLVILQSLRALGLAVLAVVAVLMPVWLLVEYLADRGATRPTTIDARLQFGAAGVGALASWACWATHASGY